MRHRCCHIWIMFHMALRYVVTEYLAANPPLISSPPPLPAHLTDSVINCTEPCATELSSTTTDHNPKVLGELKIRTSGAISSSGSVPSAIAATVFPRITLQRPPVISDTYAEDDPGELTYSSDPRPAPQLRGGAGWGIAAPENERLLLPPPSSTTFQRTTQNTPLRSRILSTSITVQKVTAKSTHRASVTQKTVISSPPTPLHHQQKSGLELVNASDSLSGHDYFLVTFNGTCDTIESSHEAAEGFVTSFQKAFASLFETLSQNNVHVWQISCDSVIVNFSLTWDQSHDFRLISDRIFHRNLAVNFGHKIYKPISFVRLINGNAASGINYTLSRLEIGAVSGHVYQAFIYVVVGAIIGVSLLIVATILIVRLHRRTGQTFTVSGESTPVKYDNVNDYTLTRIPRTTKLYLDDIERNPWAYTNPDFQGSLSSIVAPKKKMEYLSFVNAGPSPTGSRSPASNNPLLSMSTDAGSDERNGGKPDKAKPKVRIDDPNEGRSRRPSKGKSDGSPYAVKFTPSAGWDSTHI